MTLSDEDRDEVARIARKTSGETFERMYRIAEGLPAVMEGGEQ